MRLLKRFFIKVLNINSSEVNQEVDLIENHVSDKFVQRLSEYLRTKQF
ncbi:iron dependent repressor, metal binding and dimerization domain protein [Staphylococcus epidermidis]